MKVNANKNNRSFNKPKKTVKPKKPLKTKINYKPTKPNNKPKHIAVGPVNKSISQAFRSKIKHSAPKNVAKTTTKSNSGISVITITNKPLFMTNLFNNFIRQKYTNKEFILVVNSNNLDINKYKNKASKYNNIKVYKLTSNYTLGRCLNYAISKSKYPIIAKFDDDDYYSPKYLRYNMNLMAKLNADVIGKKSHLVYFKSNKILAIRHPGNENKYVNFVNGSTLFFKKIVNEAIPFRNVNAAEDVFFCNDCIRSRVKIYSSSRNHHIYIRYPNKTNHTWKIRDHALLTKFCRVLKKNVTLNELKKEQSTL